MQKRMGRTAVKNYVCFHGPNYNGWVGGRTDDSWIERQGVKCFHN